jgi:hypothetical protein
MKRVTSWSGIARRRTENDMESATNRLHGCWLLRCARNDDLILRDRKMFQSAAADIHEKATA